MKSIWKVIRMLGNKRKDFIDEIIVTISLDIITGIALALTYPGGPKTASDYFIAFFVPLLIYFPTIRLFRYAFVYHAYVVLYFLYSFFIIVLLFVGADIVDRISKGSNEILGSMAFFTVVLAAFIIYTIYILVQRKRGLFKKTVPPERIQVLRTILTPKEKLTLVFPDRYIKYLETGDERYLEKNGGK